MKIALTAICGMGSYFLFGMVVPVLYGLNLDVPGISVSPAVTLWGIVIGISLLAWAKID